MKVFRKEYITLAFLMAFRVSLLVRIRNHLFNLPVQTFVGFMNPVAVNRLLTWVSWLFAARLSVTGCNS